jgi:hypothetical protein
MHRVERAGLDALAQAEAGEPAPKFAGGLAREREDERVARPSAVPVEDAVGDTPGQHPRLAGAGAGDHGHQRSTRS